MFYESVPIRYDAVTNIRGNRLNLAGIAQEFITISKITLEALTHTHRPGNIWQFAISKITSQELLADPDCAPESAKSVSTSRTAHMRVTG